MNRLDRFGSASWTASKPASKPTFACTEPGCTKSFLRKEHLNRHMRGHDPARPYQCTYCDRTFARSDILRRHTHQHTSPTPPKRTASACAQCHRRKLKCNAQTPCKTCIADGVECVRNTARRDSNKSIQRKSEEPATQQPKSSWPEMPPQTEAPALDSLQPLGLNICFQTPDPWPYPMDMLSAPEMDPSSFPLINQPMMDMSCAPLNPPVYFQQQTSQIPIQPGLEITSFPDFMPQSGLHLAPPHPPSLPPSLSDSASQGDAEDLRDPIFVKSEHGRERSTIAQFKRPRITTTATRTSTSGGDATDKRRKLIWIFFSKFHPSWPVLHMPTFGRDRTEPLLLEAVLAIGSWLDGEACHRDMSASLARKITGKLLGETDAPPSLALLQALLLLVIHFTTCTSCDASLTRVLQLHNLLVLFVRRIILSDGRPQDGSFSDSKIDWWVVQEQSKRLAFATMRIDAYISVITDQPPILRHEEIDLSLPVTDRLWAAFRSEEVRDLLSRETVGRGEQPFSALMRDSMLTHGRSNLTLPLNEDDFHLILCGMQTGFWEAAHEYRCSFCCNRHNETGALDPILSDFKNAAAQRTYFTWREQLSGWQYVKNEVAFATSNTHAPQQDQRQQQLIATQSTLLFHVSQIALHANLRLLQGSGCCSRCAASSSHRATDQAAAEIRRWSQSCDARIAVYSAGRLCNIFLETPSESSLGTTINDRKGSGDHGVAASACDNGNSGGSSSTSDNSRRIAEESRRNRTRELMLNPLAMIGLLHAATVLIAYICQLEGSGQCCPSCNNNGGGAGAAAAHLLDLAAVPVIDLTSAALEDAHIEAWISGSRLAALDGRLLCACRKDELIAWFGERLAAYKHYTRTFESFVKWVRNT